MTVTPTRLAVAALWLGSVAATWAVSGDRRRVPAPALAPAAVTAPRVSGPAAGEIRAAARDARPVATTPSLPDDPAPEEPAPDDTVYVQALSALEHDLADGRWTEAERDRLAGAMAQVTPDQAMALVSILFPRLNAATVTSDIDGPPL